MTDVLPSVVILVSILLVSILNFAVTFRTMRSSGRSEMLGEDRFELLREQWNRLEFLREERQTLIAELERQSRERQQLTELLGKTPPQLVEDLQKERRGHQAARKQIEDLKQERLRLEQELHHLEEQLKRDRQEHLGSQRRAEQLERQQKEQARIQQEVERLSQEHQRLTEELKKEREGHSAAQRRVEQQEKERTRLERVQQEVERLSQEHQRLTEELKKEREGHSAAQRRVEQQEKERTRLERELRRLRATLDSRGRAPARDQAKESELGRPWWRRPVLVVGLIFGALLLWLTSLIVGLYLVSP